MFRSISVNNPTKHGKKIFNCITDNQKVNFSFGRPEWQQEFKSTSRIYHDIKKLTDNTMKLNKDYIKRNYSQFDMYNFPQENHFMTSNERDYKTIPLKTGPQIKSELELVQKRMKFIRSSHINLGDYIPEKETTYRFNYNEPKDQKPRYDFNKVNFKFNPYNINPITQELIWKDPNRMNGFDYYHKDKDKRYVIRRSYPIYNNKDYTKVFDPITNRYFIGSLRYLPNIKI